MALKLFEFVEQFMETFLLKLTQFEKTGIQFRWHI